MIFTPKFRETWYRTFAWYPRHCGDIHRNVWVEWVWWFECDDSVWGGPATILWRKVQP